MTTQNDIFIRSRLLYGDDIMQRTATARVILFGVGGVGSWCAEGLVRSGIRHLTIVDSDNVSVSNINRQLPALSSTVGRPKVEVLRQRLLDINPEADINAVLGEYNPDTAGDFRLDDYDYVIDAIDSLSDKALLILRACSSRATLFSSMGAALKTDPDRIAVAEFWKVKGCPLAASLRRRFRKDGTFPQKKFRCVYSGELAQNRFALESDDPRKKAVNGSVVHITAIYGFRLCALVMGDIARKTL